MANYQLKNDHIDHIPIISTDLNGDIVPDPAGDTYTVASSSASVNAVIGAMISTADPAVVINATVMAGTGYTVTLSDSSGLTVYILTLDIVSDLTPTALGLSVGAVESGTQPVPTAPGP